MAGCQPPGTRGRPTPRLHTTFQPHPQSSRRPGKQSPGNASLPPGSICIMFKIIPNTRVMPTMYSKEQSQCHSCNWSSKSAVLQLFVVVVGLHDTPAEGFCGWSLRFPQEEGSHLYYTCILFPTRVVAEVLI